MKILKDVMGLAVVLFAWFNPLGADIIIRSLLFIIGFELMSMWIKVGVLAFSVLTYQTFGVTFSIILGGLFMLDIVMRFLIPGVIIALIVRALLVGGAGFLVSQSAQHSALIGAGYFVLSLILTKLRF